MPEEIILNGKVYVAAVFRVETRRENGTPAQLTYIGLDDTCELSKDVTKNCFIVGYIPKTDYSQFAGQIPEI